MTAAIALAMTTEDGRSAVSVVADSRLTLKDREPVDTFVKAIELGPESIIVVAGNTLPATVAAELARPLVRNMHANALKASAPVRVSLLEEVRQFLAGHALVHRELRSIKTDSIAAGSFGDGSPGLVRITIHGSSGAISVLRPGRGAAVAVGVGSASTVGLAIDALRLVVPRSVNEAVTALGSMLWATIQADDVPGVGGGLLIGYSVGAKPWLWPVVKIAGRSFYRGILIKTTPEGWHEYLVAYDSTLLARVTEKRIDAPYGDQLGAVVWRSEFELGGDTPTRWSEIPKDWTLTEREKEILTR